MDRLGVECVGPGPSGRKQRRRPAACKSRKSRDDEEVDEDEQCFNLWHLGAVAS